jgi:transcriptional regulator of acetoin/glycerol metabolism
LTLPDLELPDNLKERWPTATEGLHEMERSYILQILEECGWRVKGSGSAAERLKLNPTTFYSKMKKFGLRGTLSYVPT